MHDGSDWAIMLGVLVLLGLAAYLLPVAIAASRSHPNTIAIAALNILLGWTMLGWIASLVWALTAVEGRPTPPASPASPGARTKPCPFCAEPVLTAAIKCRHCGSVIAASAGQAGQPDLPHDRSAKAAQRRIGIPGLAIGVSLAVGIVLVGWLTLRATSGGQIDAASGILDPRSEVPFSATVGPSTSIPAASSNQIAEGEAHPTFSCTKARSAAERLICQDRQLSGLDVQLANLYAVAKASAADSDEFKRATSAAWADRERRCADKQCLLGWYANRSAALLAQIAPQRHSLLLSVEAIAEVPEHSPGRIDL